MTYVWSCNANPPRVLAVWSFVFQKTKETLPQRKRSSTAECEIKLPHFQSGACNSFHGFHHLFVFSEFVGHNTTRWTPLHVWLFFYKHM